MHPKQPINTSEAALHAVDYWQIVKNRYGIILLTFILVVITAAVITYVMSKKFEATAQVEIRPMGSKAENFGNISGREMTRQFYGTQFQIIESPGNIRRAVEKCQLTTNWNVDEETAVKIISNGLSVTNIRGTDIIQISVRLNERYRTYVKPITEAVAKSYGEMRMELDDKRREEARYELAKKLQQQRDLVEDHRNRLLAFSSEKGIPYYDKDTTSGVNSLGLRRVSRNDEQYDLALKSLNELKVQVEALVGLKDESLISHVAGMNFTESALIGTLYANYQDAKRERNGLLAEGLGSNHPRIKMFDAQIDTMRKQLDVKVVEIRDILKMRLEQQKSTVARLKTTLDESQVENLADAKDYTEFNTYVQEYEDARSVLNMIKQSDTTEEVLAGLSNEPIIFHEYPREPDPADYVSPNWVLNMALGSVAGLIFGIGIAFGLELMDTSVKSLDDVERYLQVPVLAVIPKGVGILSKQIGASPDAEAYRILRTNIEFNRGNPSNNAITVVSGGAGEGKSTTLVNLAYICAQGGYTTLIIDADLRRPRIHTFFDINNTVGLTNYLTTDLQLEDVVLQTPVENLYFMPSGILPADAAGILNSRRMSEAVQEVKKRFDLVLIDSPPILGVSDASVLASEVDLTMIVVQHRKLPRNMLVRVKQAIENVGGTVLGVVLNNVDVRSDSQYQYYTSYYTYYAPSEVQKPTGQLPSLAKKEASSLQNSSNDLY